MRNVYLLRHAAPEMPGGVRRCLGSRTDPPLSPEGAAAAEALAAFFREKPVTAVGTSPLLRCRQTAQLVFSDRPRTVLPGIAELDCGEWEGLSFTEIREKYPELHALRGRDASVPPPGGETSAHGAARGLAAIEEFLSRTEGDVAVVAHSGIGRAMLCALYAKPYSRLFEISLDYLGIYCLRWDGTWLRPEPVDPAADAQEGAPI